MPAYRPANGAYRRALLVTVSDQIWLFFAFGDLCRLRKHGSNGPRLAGESKYFCDSSVIFAIGIARAEILRS